MNIAIGILTFMYLFEFELLRGVLISKSSIICGGFLILYSLINRSYLMNVKNTIFSKVNFTIIVFILLVFIWGGAVVFLNNTFDYSFLALILHLLLNVEIGMLIIALLKLYKVNVMNLIINVFLIQSFIQIFSFISPSFMEITDIFRSDSTILLRDTQYGGIRGLAIAGSAFFGLGASYGILFSLLGGYWNAWDKKLYIKVIYICCLIFGSITAARISLVGIFIFFFTVLKSKIMKEKNLEKWGIKLFVGLMILAISLSFVYILWGNMIEDLLYRSEYISQIFQIWSTGSDLSLDNVSSLDILFNDMYFSLNFSQFFLGDGIYTNWDGSYYMSTDAGYMRNILYFGIWGEILLVILQYVILKNGIQKYFDKKMLWVIMGVLMIFEVKGQIIGLLVPVESFFVLFIASKNAKYR